MISKDELRNVFEEVGELRGWDWSALRLDEDPAPWDYEYIVRQHLTPRASVLDIGTGGGEVFFSLAPFLSHGVGIDGWPRMIRVALDNKRSRSIANVDLILMRAEALSFRAGRFDVVLDRHCGAFASEVDHVLKPGGLFLTQQVGGRNSQSIFDAFGWGSNGAFWRRYDLEHGIDHESVANSESLSAIGYEVLTEQEYDIKSYFLDLHSLVFYLKAAPLPEDFDPDKHWEAVNRLVQSNTRPRGIETNIHRSLLVARKPLEATRR